MDAQRFLFLIAIITLCASFVHLLDTQNKNRNTDTVSKFKKRLVRKIKNFLSDNDLKEQVTRIKKNLNKITQKDLLNIEKMLIKTLESQDKIMSSVEKLTQLKGLKLCPKFLKTFEAKKNLAKNRQTEGINFPNTIKSYLQAKEIISSYLQDKMDSIELVEKQLKKIGKNLSSIQTLEPDDQNSSTATGSKLDSSNVQKNSLCLLPNIALSDSSDTSDLEFTCSSEFSCSDTDSSEVYLSFDDC
ncbi:hypothetical protein DI09_29p310 [Mitosporidium daphniae]|uniref:Uncharacterized protein n=1 Tax=Mitosporidium daphniae TaxID=1485682 RepID=A0A098VRW1_9MICR|nr:uncharacterized protein DI09_29p310 [Mitosporidium daphniae]KGG51710.1 hypothetical protein DI09_29p310 [Mitosporidium daphniae]|eukprot:XP_013238137.1 uncharacterized protein DI09_29p310 [Mitosporidium daphniae]